VPTYTGKNQQMTTQLLIREESIRSTASTSWSFSLPLKHRLLADVRSVINNNSPILLGCFVQRGEQRYQLRQSLRRFRMYRRGKTQLIFCNKRNRAGHTNKKSRRKRRQHIRRFLLLWLTVNASHNSRRYRHGVTPIFSRDVGILSVTSQDVQPSFAEKAEFYS